MMNDLREALLDILPDEGSVDAFLEQVEGINREASTHIAISITTENADTEAADETEETDESQDTEDTELESTPDGETEQEEEMERTIELDENFLGDVVRDVVTDEEFASVVRGLVDEHITSLRTELMETIQSLRTTVADTPARQRRTVVSYRPRQRANGDSAETSSVTADQVAAATLDNMYGGK